MSDNREQREQMQAQEEYQQRLFIARTTCPCGRGITSCPNCVAHGTDCCGRPVGSGRERPALFCRECNQPTNFLHDGYCTDCDDGF